MDGILIINKPQGYTSHDIVNIVKKALNTPKVGHTGTLDPNATGVLPILIGKATKVSKYLIEHNKTYVAELALGEKSSTGDTEGEIIEKKEVPLLNEEQIKQVLKSFEGKQMQTPPIYSSIKINGKKAYEYARKGQNIQLEPRPIEIMKISFIKFENNVLKYEVQCSKGTYIRVLCEDIAERLGTVGLMKNLCRTRVNEFDIEDSCKIEQIAKEKIISIEKVCNIKPKIELDDKTKEKFLNGVKLNFNMENGVYRIYNKKIFLGLGVINNNILKRDVIIIDNF
jgi:tRNA pseudouridine55 synthase